MDKIKILVVDDESRMRKLVHDFLAREGYEVLEAGDGEEALDIFYQQKDIALLVLDIMMPRINGFEVCREIRQTSKVPIIMLTAKGDERDELNGFDIGADEYISKPVSYTHLDVYKRQVCRSEADAAAATAVRPIDLNIYGKHAKIIR